MGELEGGLRAAVATTGKVGNALYTDRLYRRIGDPLARLERGLARLQSGQGDAGRFLRDPAQYEQLRSGAAELRRSIAAVRGQDFVRSDRLYADWNRALESLIRSVDRMNASPLLVRSDVYEGMNGASRELRNAVREFRETPAKFLRLGLF